MTFLQPKVQAPKTSEDYKKTNFEVLAKDVHPIYQIEFHKQAGEMIYSTMTHKALSVQKLQNSLENKNTQLKLEKASSQEKNNMVKSLKYLVMEVGYNPKDIKVTKGLIRKKNEKIIALKKQLKLSNTEHPKTKEVLETENQKDEMMNLIIQLTS